MPFWVPVLILVAAVASRPIEAHLWRAGRLSDRTTTLLLLGRMPMLALAFSILYGGNLPLTLFLLAVALLPMALGYRFIMNLLAEQQKEAARSAKA
jgi:hypothetical protein